MQIIDTHTHYDDEAFEQDREALLESLPGKGIEKVIDVGATVDSAYEAFRLAKKWPHVYCALGVHPNEVGELTDEILSDFERLSGESKVTAIGEIGLDYHHEEPGREVQAVWFRKQIQLARRTGLPVIIHSRDAAQDTLELLREERAEEAGGVIHCYSYSPEMAQIYVSMGFYLGIGGVVTYPNARKLKETVQSVPMERILLETDCPYLTPAPHRGKRNSSLYLPHVVDAIASLRGMSAQEVIDITRENALRCFPKLKNPQEIQAAG